MKVGKLKTYWIAACSGLTTAIYSSRCVYRHLRGTSSRTWVDVILSKWSDKVLALAGIQYKVFNPFQVRPKPKTATIIMCNHTSIYDIPLSFKIFPHHSIRMLAKKELRSIPFLGQGMLSSEFVFIDRQNRHQAIKDLASARELMESGILLWIAPEGTRTLDGKLGPFKRGAFVTAIEAKATIIPVGIKGAYEILPSEFKTININQTAELHIGEPIDASNYRLENKQDLVDKVRNSIQALIS